MRKLIAVILLFTMVMSLSVNALDHKQHSIMVTATATTSPASIKLTWKYLRTDTSFSYVISRRQNDFDNWTEIAKGTSDKEITEYTDKNVVDGVKYEYEIFTRALEKDSTGNYIDVYGYISSGIKLPKKLYRGKLLLVIENTYADKLKTEIQTLIDDISTDGYDVISIDVKVSDTPESVKKKIKDYYDKDKANTRSVFLFGHVPIKYSYISVPPDGHDQPGDDHRGAWATDAYYSDMDGDWDTLNDDGITDTNNLFPSAQELEIGRVDFFDMPSFGTEYELLKRYLNKNHAYRTGKMTAQMRGLIDDGGFNMMFSRTAWGSFAALCGGFDNVKQVSGQWKETLQTDDYIWSYICGPGGPKTLSSPYLNAIDLRTPYKSIFGIMFGSWFVDWAKEDNLMRAFLTMPDYGLTNLWGGRPAWILHHMALGEPIGYSSKISQNNFDKNGMTMFYKDTGDFAGGVHMALLGDPTLRMYYVPAPTDGKIAQKEGGIELSWTGAKDNIGYNVYRSDGDEKPYYRLNAKPIEKTSFIDNTTVYANFKYKVETIKLVKNASGSFYDTSPYLYISGALRIDATPPSQDGLKVVLDYRVLTFDVQPIIESGRTLVPLRAIFEEIGMNVSYDNGNITATKSGLTIKLKIGDTTAYVNDKPIILDVPSKIVDGRTLVPLRFIAESAGMTVGYDGNTKIISLHSK